MFTQELRMRMCSVIRAHVKKQVILRHHVDDIIINRNPHSYHKYVSKLYNHYLCILNLVQPV